MNVTAGDMRVCQKQILHWFFCYPCPQLACLRTAKSSIFRTWVLDQTRKHCTTHIQSQEYIVNKNNKETGKALTQDLLDKYGQVSFKYPNTELTICSLLDMGFIEEQVVNLFERTSTWDALLAADGLSNISLLIALDLNPMTIINLVEKCPELLCIKGNLLQKRINGLRKLGLVQESLHHVVAHCPQALLIKSKQLDNFVHFLHHQCQFTLQQVREILHSSPSIILQEKANVEYTFQYAYFRMGIQQADIVKTKLFRLTFEEIRSRHIFLERLGQYETPDKKGQTHIVNPKVKDFLGVSEQMFLKKVAKVPVEEFRVFKKLLSREIEEQEKENEDLSSEEENESEDDE
ncbi:transcription termination factor 4, mitochondrial [Erpetoichthys calabaricus]|uniref:Mitochondrial transcription termination factor 4 n=1 Tax=Erpetoichthys calabaricus TaxID=27687 RepID=A0A8C4XFL2_ERPCA|nr:transcription termination factor 4, mitochondrial [Erpetoichthys calabaricus]